MSFGKIAAIVFAALTVISGQCVASCQILPCELPGHPSPPQAPKDCHHNNNKEPGSKRANCGHQALVSEPGPEASFTVDIALFAGIPPSLTQPLSPNAVLETLARHSPPLFEPSSTSILRI